jgi:uncharacterized protein
MGIVYFREPKLEKPDLIACWPGIGEVGIMAVNTLRAQLEAEELAEIESWEFFYPNKVIIKEGILKDLQFPSSRFFYTRQVKKDIIIFLAEEQPTESGQTYAAGRKAFAMAELVMDVAEKFNCGRVYTSGAAVSLIHHNAHPKVWAVTTQNELNNEIKSYANTLLMGEAEGSGRGSITGMNGLLLGAAKRRGLEAICLMGEVPDYLSRAPFPYPKASKAVLEVFTQILGVKADYMALDEMSNRIDKLVNDIFEKFPPEIRERIEARKAEQPVAETITDEDKRWLQEHIEDLFKKGGNDERPA